MHHEDWCPVFTYGYCGCDALPFGAEDPDPKYMPTAHNLARIIRRAKAEAIEQARQAILEAQIETNGSISPDIRNATEALAAIADAHRKDV